MNKTLKVASLGWLNFKIKISLYEELLKSQEKYWPQIVKENHPSFYSKNLMANTHWYSHFEAEFNWIVKNKIKVLTYWDSEYPESFRNLDFPPVIITYIGNIQWNSKKFISVVGSRNPSKESVQWLETELSEFLKRNKSIIVSGGARGIDQKAHSISIRCESPTLCLIPSGLKNLYPKSLNTLSKQIIKNGGAIVSQFSPFSEMRKFHFQLRNQLISILSEKTLIIEARRKSGTHMTAKLALNYGREIGVLPVSPMNFSGLGGLDLIYDGASILRNHLDI